jgi:hypothetical protein
VGDGGQRWVWIACVVVLGAMAGLVITLLLLRAAGLLA